jgi:hypothetical protein
MGNNAGVVVEHVVDTCDSMLDVLVEVAPFVLVVDSDAEGLETEVLDERPEVLPPSVDDEPLEPPFARKMYAPEQTRIRAINAPASAGGAIALLSLVINTTFLFLRKRWVRSAVS